VISGYEPSGVGEIALGAMQLAMHDNDEHWVQMLGNLGVHEAGYLGVSAVPKQATLDQYFIRARGGGDGDANQAISVTDADACLSRINHHSQYENMCAFFPKSTQL